jgi:hypothetical protein
MQIINNNGRVIDVRKPTKPYKMFTQNNNNNDNFKNTALKHIQQKSPLSMVYFSEENMNRVQNMIRYKVWLGSNKRHIISKQSSIELQIVMRSIYLQYSKNLPCKIGEQVYELNNMVVTWCVQKILTEIDQYLNYLNNLETLPQEIDLPKNLSSAGTKTLRSVTSLF